MVVRDVPNKQSYTAQPRAHPQKVNENNGFSQSFSIFYFFISRDYNNKYHHSLEGIANPPVSPCCLAAFFRKQIHIDKKLKLCTSADYSNELLILALELKESQIRKKNPMNA